MVDRIDRETLCIWMNEKQPIVLLETSKQEDYQRTHLPGAIFMAPDLVAANARATIPGITTPIVVYSTDIRSPDAKRVTTALGEMGYQHVFEYCDGKADWIAHSLPVEGTLPQSRVRYREPQENASPAPNAHDKRARKPHGPGLYRPNGQIQ